MRTINNRELTDIQADIDQKLAQMQKITSQVKAEKRDLTADEVAAFDTIDCELRVLNNEKAKAERDSAQLRGLHDRIASGDIDVPDYLKAGTVGFGSPGWQRDSKGRTYAILDKDDRATNLLKPACKNAFGHYVLASLFGANKSTPPSVQAALTGDSNHLGGFLVPEILLGELIDLQRAMARLMQAGTRTILMDSDALLIPTLQSDVVPEVKAENAPFTDSNPTFGQVRLQTMTAGCVATMSRELADDAREILAEQLGTVMVRAMSVAVDKWGLAGTGSEEPTGLLNRGGIEGTGTIGALDWVDVADAVTELRNLNHEPNAVIMHPQRYADLFNTETGDGTNSARGWLDAPPTLRDMLFLQTTNCPEDKLVVGDFTKYCMGMRTGALVEATTTGGDAFKNHQLLVKISMRFDFNCLDQSAFHILSGITD